MIETMYIKQIKDKHLTVYLGILRGIFEYNQQVFILVVPYLSNKIILCEINIE